MKKLFHEQKDLKEKRSIETKSVRRATKVVQDEPEGERNAGQRPHTDRMFSAEMDVQRSMRSGHRLIVKVNHEEGVNSIILKYDVLIHTTATSVGSHPQ